MENNKEPMDSSYTVLFRPVDNTILRVGNETGRVYKLREYVGRVKSYVVSDDRIVDYYGWVEIGEYR